MPIQTQCCGLLIVCIIIYLTYREHNLMLPSKKLYLILSFATFFCIGLDILSVIGIVVPFPPFWMYLVCRAYLTSLVLVCYFGFLYTDEELHLYFSEKKHTWQKMVIILIGIAGAILPLLLPIHVYYDGTVLYSYGPACICTYFFCFLFNFTTLGLCLFRMKHVNWHRRRVIIIWQLIYIVASIIQYLHPKYLIVGFATSAGMFLLFSQLENPAEEFDRTFTQSYFASDKTKYVMQSVIEMFRNLGLFIIIEGIETKNEFDLIQKLPINCIQGYYFSRPLPENEFLQFLEASGNPVNV